MPISSLSSSTIAAIPKDTSAAGVQLLRDQQRLAADLRAKASEAQLRADQAAIVRDQMAVQSTKNSHTDAYL
jgi:hypothetical protein